MKIIIKFLQYTIKTLAAILSKIGAQYTYTKLWKYFMKFKLITIIYKPLKNLLSNFIYFIKLASAIISVFSLFNISIIYFDYDILNEINDLVNKLINYIKLLYNKWFEDNEEIEDPIDFFQYKNNLKKVADSTTNHSYWMLPIIILGYAGLYYFNPHIDLNEIIKPVLEQIEDKLPEGAPTIAITGIFIYKIIIVSISYISGYDLNIFTDDDPISPDSKKAIKDIVNSTTKYDSLDNEDDIDKYFKYVDNSEDNLETPKASTSKLPETITNKNDLPVIGENPYKKVNKFDKNIIDTSKVKIEDWN